MKSADPDARPSPRPTLPYLLIAAAAWSFSAATTLAAETDCLDTNAALGYWRPIREAAATEELAADELAIELISCLGSPNRELRDRIGYELFTYWLRRDKLSDATRRRLLIELSAHIADTSDEDALLRSFSALILSELVRSDAIRPFMDDNEREDLLDRAIVALDEEADFRGLDPEVGWVHPVAHIADLLWRFALHPATNGEQGVAILHAIRTKVAPTVVAYTFNEGDRLARVVATLIQRELVSVDEVVDWASQFEVPQSMNTWTDAFLTRAGMTELHNTKLFLRALSDQLRGADIDPAVSQSIVQLLQGFTQLI
jgi:hypothetical protein